LIPRASLLHHHPREDRPSGKEEDDGRLSTNRCRDVLDVTRDRGETIAAGYGGAESPSGGRNLRRLASAGGPRSVAGDAGTHPDAYGAGIGHGVSGDRDAAQVSRLPTAGSRGLGRIQEALGSLGLGPTEHQNPGGLSRGALAQRDVGDGEQGARGSEIGLWACDAVGLGDHHYRTACERSSRSSCPRNHFTQKAKIAGQRTLYLSVPDDEYPSEIFPRQNVGSLIKSPAERLTQDPQDDLSPSNSEEEA